MVLLVFLFVLNKRKASSHLWIRFSAGSMFLALIICALFLATNDLIYVCANFMAPKLIFLFERKAPYFPHNTVVTNIVCKFSCYICRVRSIYVTIEGIG